MRLDIEVVVECPGSCPFRVFYKMTPERGSGELTFEQFLTDPSVVLLEPPPLFRADKWESMPLMPPPEPFPVFRTEGEVTQWLAGGFGKSGVKIEGRIREFDRCWQILKADWTLFRALSLHLRGGGEMCDFGNELMLPFRNVALVGPPNVGKTSLVVSVSRVVSASVSYHYLDAFSDGDQYAVQGKRGWKKGGKKRRGNDLDFAKRFLAKIEKFRESETILSVADMPGGKQSRDEWFYHFLIDSFDTVVVLGRETEGEDEWIHPYGEDGVSVGMRVLVVSGDEAGREVPAGWDAVMPDLEGESDPLNPGVLAVGEKLLEWAFDDLVRVGVIS